MSCDQANSVVVSLFINKDEIPNEDLVFDDNLEHSVGEITVDANDVWEGEWGSFFFKKNDDLHIVCNGLNKYNQSVKGNASGGTRKRKPKEKGEKGVINKKKQSDEMKIKPIIM